MRCYTTHKYPVVLKVAFAMWCSWLVLAENARADDMALWTKVVTAAQIEDRAVKSLQLSFKETDQNNLSLLHDPLADVHQDRTTVSAVSLTIDGLKYREDIDANVTRGATLQGPGPVEPTHTTRTVAFDERFAWSRSSDIAADVLCATQLEAYLGFLRPPSQTLAILTPEQLDQHLHAGLYKIQSISQAKLNDHDCLKVVFLSNKTGYTLSFWYAVDCDYKTIQVEDRDKSGQLMNRSVVDAFCEVGDPDGHTHFMVLRGKCIGYSAGKILIENDIDVNKSTIHINAPTDGKMFKLVLKPEESILDVENHSSSDHQFRDYQIQ